MSGALKNKEKQMGIIYRIILILVLATI